MYFFKIMFMNVVDLKALQSAGEDVMLVDVCEGAECAMGPSIDGAVNIPMGQMFVDAAQGKLPKDKKIVAICKSGYRCKIVADELRAKGYDIEYLEGGVKAWNDAQ